ncbi:MAG: 50S ribosomal protein L6 [Candidatus Komeilibacteria bacterium CG10_big_fil_rev_8_21_14_0_10_41_13]|uniref:Large ribosomal subunit protein uL6 n=1 Tax=Candidatus Komeilibacteria bacterium CG10_big_fil_rev_8_21_14_0_10_41_13 TaxID=1974476 RepID=A0A2M6WDE0_9BACT|nr:MAG: 50S ribosomal protein L6 [Candidatus Komeilibacteria bacterium CG10_big_fil_rev_8_21_14_0_10_41_13]
MSRIGKKPIEITKGVEVKIDNNLVMVKGPKGELKEQIHPKIKLELKDNQLNVLVANEENKEERSLWGLSRTLINNMVLGVTEGFSKQLEINGIGFKAEVKGDKLVLNLGFSHPVEYQFPKGITIQAEKNLITVSGIDKQLVGQVSAKIRSFKKPEPYKGKGIKYLDEVIRRKAGKVVKGGE